MFSQPIVELPQTFLEDLCDQIVRARKRIYLQAMVIEACTIMDRVAPLLCAAAERHVDVRLYYDWVTHRYLHGDIRLTPTFDRKLLDIERMQHSRNTQLFSDLAKSGVQIIEMNAPRGGVHFFPVMGRNHIKIYVVDDVAWMGGLNFFDSSFQNLDFMVRFDAPEMVHALRLQAERVNEHKPRNDYMKEISGIGRLVVDSGKRGRSLIYEHALEMVQAAHKEIIFVSQLVPEYRMLDLLVAKANAGVRVVIYTSNSDDSTFTRYPLRFFYLEFRKRLSRHPGIFHFIHLNCKIHAKLIMVDSDEAMFGSHNFVESGIQMGTQEIALHTRDPHLVSQLSGFVRSLSYYVAM